MTPDEILDAPTTISDYEVEFIEAISAALWSCVGTTHNRTTLIIENDMTAPLLTVLQAGMEALGR